MKTKKDEWLCRRKVPELKEKTESDQQEGASGNEGGEKEGNIPKGLTSVERIL